MSYWEKIKGRVIVLGLHCLLKIYLFLGRRAILILLYPCLGIYWLINSKGRQASLQYLQRIEDFQKENKIEINHKTGFFSSFWHFISFAHALVDKLAAWTGTLDVKQLEYNGREEIVAHIKKGQGVLILGSHLGNLEMGRFIVNARKKVAINILVHTKYAENFNLLLNSFAGSERVSLIQVTEINSTTTIMLQDKIAAGELIIIAADRTSFKASLKDKLTVARANFLGEAALFPQEPFMLALLLKCPVYTLFCLREKKQQSMYFDHFSDGLSFTRKERTAAIEQCVQEYADQLQNYCLKAPLQWFNFYDFWQADR